MACKENLNNKVNGWLIINKPKFYTSNKVLILLKKKFKFKKVGFCGTLDPLAIGMLPIAIGEARKFIRFLTNHKKTYIFSVKWGVSTTTYDIEGQIISKTEFLPNRESIEKTLKLFIGNIHQVPPIFSAIRVGGTRAYKLARKNKKFVLSSRRVKIWDLKILDHSDYPSVTTFSLTCGSGTYVRSLAVDIAKKLGTLGCVSYINRISFDPFPSDSLIALDTLYKLNNTDSLNKFLLPFDQFSFNLPSVSVSNEDSLKLKNGLRINFDQYATKGTNRSGYIIVKNNKKSLAIGYVNANNIVPKRVFNF